MPLCNQGCGTKVYFRDNRPYNISNDEPHEKTCMSLKIGKWWGGYYNTIPIDRILTSLEHINYSSKRMANEPITISDLHNYVNYIASEMEYVMRQVRDQTKWNEKKEEEFQEYKTTLVQQQTLREERRRNRMQGSKAKFPAFNTADQEFKDDIFGSDVHGLE